VTVPALFQNGRRIQLGRRIGKGGEGEVYAIDGRKNVALKFYTSPDPGDRAGKVMAMVRSGLAEKSKLVSFPSAVIEDGKGRLVGFLMRLVHGHQPIHHLYGPADRKANFPGVTYAFLVHAALNVARAVAEVHLRNCVIGDINHSGILVSTEAMVALIDADSFQITDGASEFLCAVGVPEYTPPELQGRSLTGIRRSANHDAFGLAVIVFQLLCMGRHPFAGAYEHGEMPLEKAIEEHRFAYSTKRAVGMRPPPGTVALGDFPPPLRAAFEAAFDPGAQRPTAPHWVTLLEMLANDLRSCPSDRQHRYSSAASECPWCRIERLVGVVLFPSPGSTKPSGGGSSAGGFDLRAIWKAIEAVPLPPVTPPNPRLPDVDPPPSREAQGAARAMRTQWTRNCVLMAIAICGYFGAPLFSVGWMLLGFYNAFRFAVPLGVGNTFRKRRTDADKKWNIRLDEWRNRSSGRDAHNLRASLTAAVQELQSAPERLRAELAGYDSRRRETQLRAHLERHRIRDAKIKGIGDSLKTALSAAGIRNASQVNARNVLAVNGVGQAKARSLEVWRQQVAASFRFDVNPNATDAAEKDRIKQDAKRIEDQLKVRLSQGPKELDVAARKAFACQQAIDPTLAQAVTDLRQAWRDDELVNVALRERPARLGLKGWVLVCLAGVGTSLGLNALPAFDWTSPTTAASTKSEAALDRFDPPRSFRVAPGRGVRTVNVRAEPSDKAEVTGRLRANATMAAIGMTKSADGRQWLAFERAQGKLGYVAASLLKPVAAAKKTQKACADGAWPSRALCDDAALRRQDRDVDAAYRRAVSAVPRPERAAFEIAQREWLAGRAACETKRAPRACLSDLYRSRLLELKAAVRREKTPERTLQGPPSVEIAAPASIPRETPPALLGNMSSLVSADDYPASSIRNAEAGRVSVRMHIDRSGFANDCEVILSSGYRTLDAATCRLMIRKARYAPARDAGGRIVDGFATQSLTWQLPRE